MSAVKHAVVLALLAFVATATMLPAPAAAEAPQAAERVAAIDFPTPDLCPGDTCKKIGGALKGAAGAVIPEDVKKAAGAAAGSVKGSIDAATSTVKAIKNFSPSNLAESWAQNMAEGAVWMMGKAQSWIEVVHKPAFGTAWFSEQYAVMFGLSLIIFAFLLIWVGAKVADSRNGAAGGVAMAKEAGFKIWVIPVVLALGPALLLTFSEVAAAVSKAFGDQAAADAGDSMTALTKKMSGFADGFGSIGGAFVAMIVFALVVLAMIALIVTMAIASWGINILALILPLVLVLYINPKWRQQFHSLFGLLVTLLLMPAFVNLVFWVFWGSVKNFQIGEDMLSNAIFVVVGAGLLAAAPMLSVWLIPKVVPEAGSMSELPQPSMDRSAFGPAQRLHAKMSGSSETSSAAGPAPSASSSASSSTSAAGPSPGGGDAGQESPSPAPAQGAAEEASPETAAVGAAKTAGHDAVEVPASEGRRSAEEEAAQEQAQSQPLTDRSVPDGEER